MHPIREKSSSSVSDATLNSRADLWREFMRTLTAEWYDDFCSLLHYTDDVNRHWPLYAARIHAQVRELLIQLLLSRGPSVPASNK